MTNSTSAQSICPKASPFARSDATQRRPTQAEGLRKPTRKALDATYASSAFLFSNIYIASSGRLRAAAP